MVTLPTALLLSACGASDSDGATPSLETATTKYVPPADTPSLTPYKPKANSSPSETAEPAEDEAEGTSETAFIAAVAINAPVFSSLSDDDLVTFGHNSCADLDASQDFYDTAFFVAEAGSQLFGTEVDPVDAAGLVGAAIGSLCEEHTALLQ